MRVLDSLDLHNSIDYLLKQITAQMDQLKTLENKINYFSNLDDTFAGNGGKAIRTYYADWHKPFLTFYYSSLKNYTEVLNTLKQASMDLEPDAIGFIRQSFLEGELTTAINDIQTLTTELVDETNQVMDTVNDIVSLPKLNDNQFHTDIQQANKHIQQTITDLEKFDTNQTKAMEPVEQDIVLMTSYLQEMQAVFNSQSMENYRTSPFNKSLTRFVLQKTLFERTGTHPLLSRITVPSEYEALNQFFLYNAQNFSGQMTAVEAMALSGVGVANPSTVKKVADESKDEWKIGGEVEDRLGADGIGNAELFLKHNSKEDVASFEASASIVDTEKAEDVPDFVDQKLFYGDFDMALPYNLPGSTWDSLKHGQHMGVKVEADVSKSTFKDNDFPLSADFIIGQGELKANAENYTASAGASVSAAKLEIKLEPFNFFGYKPLEEWFGFEYDPFIGVDISLGSLGLGGSVGMETSAKVGAGLIGIGGKIGLEKDEEKE